MMSLLCPGYQLWMLGELIATMVQFVHGLQDICPLVVISHMDSGLSLVNCFGQWDKSTCDMSTGLLGKCLCTGACPYGALEILTPSTD